MFKKSILKLGIPSLLFALTIAILSVVTGGSIANADVPSSHDPNARGSWVNAYYIDYDGQRFVDSNPNDGNHTYIYTSPGSNPCTSDIKFDGDPIWQNGDAQNAKVTVRSPAASGGCEQKSTEAPAGFDNTGNREIFFFTDTDGNIKHVNKAGLIFKKQSGYWYNPADGDGSDAGGNPCRDIIAGETLISVQPVEKNTVQANQYERFYQAIGKTPPASGLVCASTLGAIKVAETYSINTNIPPSEITGAGGMLRLHIGPASSATGPNVGQAAPEDKDPNSNNPGDNPPTCEAGALGWIICAVVNFMSGVNDIMFSLIETRLYIDPVKVETNGPLYNVWAAFRNIANIAFVIAFLVVIFSQATSIGLSSYGIKKMLPRIIITAILVNLSFFICQIALDFSNVIGGSIGTAVNNILSGMDRTIDIHETGWSAFVAWIIAGGAAVGTFAVILGSGGIAAAISLLLPFLITALFAVLTALVVIIAREAIVILLIAISPIAFVAYILPNTEKYFEKWRSLAVTMLLLYPFVALLFAGSKLAAAIILGPGDGSGFGSDPLVALTALVVMFVPLFGVPFIVRFSGNLLGRIAGAINNPNRGPFDALKKRAEGYSEYKQNQAKTRNLSNPKSKNPFAFAARSKRNREYKYGLAKGFADETEQEYTARRLYDKDNMEKSEKRAQNLARAAGGPPEAAVSIQASAKAAVDKLDRESIQKREILLKAQFDPRQLLDGAQSALSSAIIKGDAIGARAANNILLKGGTPGLTKIGQAISDAEDRGLLRGGPNDHVGAQLREDINASGLKPKENALAAWAYTANVDTNGNPVNNTYEGIQTSQKTYAGLSDREMVGQIDGNVFQAGKTQAIDAQRAESMLKNDTLKQELTFNKRAILQAVIDGTIQTKSQQTIIAEARAAVANQSPGSGNINLPPPDSGSNGGNTPPTTGPVAPNPGSTPPSSGSGGAAATPSSTTQNFNQSSTTTNYNTTQNVSGDIPRPTTGGFQGDMQIPRSPASPGTPPSNNPPEDNGGIRLPPRQQPDSPPDDERP